jgi:uracil-DNA glycosylase
MNYDKVKTQFGSWAPKFKPFIESEEMDKIFGFLKTRAQAGKIICPHHTDVFRAFRECEYSKLKCVIIGKDPYPWIKDGSYAADGLAFSNSHTGELEPSLTTLYDGMEDDIARGFDLNMIRNPDLSYLAAQGVLLLNSSLTCEQDHIGVHAPFIEGTKQVYVWKPFIEFLLDDILNQFDRTIFIFMGADAQKYSKIPVPFTHHIFEIEHPAAGLHQKPTRPWNHQNVFSRVNAILRASNGPGYEIKWFEHNGDFFPTY